MTLKRLEIKFALPSSIKLNQAIGSIMQGVLMENIDHDYATYLHRQNLRPYSQYIFFSKKQNCLVWRISILNDEANNEILLPLSKLSEHVLLRKKKTTLTVLSKECTYNSNYEMLAQKYFSSDNIVDNKHTIDFKFITSTAFKSQGQYIIFPEPQLIIYSLLNRWNALSPLNFLQDRCIAEQLQQHLYVDNYQLNMRPFSLEGIRVPAFVGLYSLGITKNDMAQRIFAMLSEFAMLSGIGIKTAIGMGAVRTCIRY